MKAKARLYLTADRSRAVQEGDPAAAFLFCIAGDEIPDALAARYGIGQPEQKQPAPIEPSPIAPENRDPIVENRGPENVPRKRRDRR